MSLILEDGSGTTMSFCGFRPSCTSASSRNRGEFRNRLDYASRVVDAGNLRSQVECELGDVVANGNGDGLGAAAHTKFAVTTRQMGLHGAGTDEERLSDLGTGATFHKQAQHVDLADRQSERRCGPCLTR